MQPQSYRPVGHRLVPTENRGIKFIRAMDLDLDGIVTRSDPIDWIRSNRS